MYNENVNNTLVLLCIVRAENFIEIGWYDNTQLASKDVRIFGPYRSYRLKVAKNTYMIEVDLQNVSSKFSLQARIKVVVKRGDHEQPQFFSQIFLRHHLAN